LKKRAALLNHCKHILRLQVATPAACCLQQLLSASVLLDGK